jgi:transposase
VSVPHNKKSIVILKGKNIYWRDMVISMEERMDIWSLKRQGFSERAIGRRLGLHRNTVKKYLEAGEIPKYSTVNRTSKLEPYHGLIKGWLSQEDYQATRINDLVQLQGYTGSYETVKRFVHTVKEKRDRLAYIRFETMPGLQAQVDFGDFKVVDFEGNEITLYAFVMVLGFSRHMYVEFVERCTMTAFLDCHRNAFGFFGGIPGEILYDNMKNVVIRHHVGHVEFNDTFMDFATHYGFKTVACPPYSPWYKGKVERPMHYIRERFWRGYRYTTLERLNLDIRCWLTSTASSRTHGTTKQKVCNRFAAEKPLLGNLPNRPYDTSEKATRKVYKDCQISFGGNRYLVSHTCVGKKLLLKIKNGIIRIYHDDKLLVVYRIPEGKGHLVADQRFYIALRKDREQMKRKCMVPKNKGKATRGILKHGLIHEMVQKRPLSFYEKLAGGGSCLN